MTKKKIILILLCVLLVIVGSPILIDHFIFGNNVYSNIGNESWAGFLGSYLGAIMGGVFSLIGIAITILFAREQNSRDRELQIRPYFDFMFTQTEEIVSHKKEVGYLAFECDPDLENEIDKKPILNGILVLKNIGVGTAINCSAKFSYENINRRIQPILFQPQGRIVGVQAFESGEEGGMPFHICMNLAPIPKEVFEDAPFGKIIPKDIIKNYPIFTIKMEFEYSDLLENRYQQILSFKINTYAGAKQDGSQDAHYSGDIHLIDVSSPIKKAN